MNRQVEKALACIALALAALVGPGCGPSTTDAPPPCDQKCQDALALRAIRETIKLAYNLTFQGQDAGHHEVGARCPLGGKGRVAGDATSNAAQGATFVDIVYDFDGCTTMAKQPGRAYRMTLTGQVREKGVIAVQPTATTALLFDSASLTLAGTVSDPPIAYEAAACVLAAGQNGNHLSGVLCEREVGLDL
ncbi:MAG TPA: hypothetical protein VJT73_07130 [Polyangiaceae bacterium]|nr:hypothetical protein [Polyangiaceae bacterium]